MEDIRIIHQFEEGNKTFIIAESVKKYCKCPSCGIVSDKIHSKYTRKMFNGSLDGSPQEIILIARKFKCKEIFCNQEVFTERFDFIDPYGRLPNNIIEIIKILGLSTSAEKVSKIMSKLGIKISHDTVLRTLRKLPKGLNKINESVTNIGVDDFAFRKGKNYCTLICDMDKRKVLDILPSRNKKDLSEWLKNYPHIKLVSRDGSITYASAIKEALPKAEQISDKFHLIKNLLDSISQYIKRKYPRKLVISSRNDDMCKSDIGNQNNVIVIDNRNLKNRIREEKISAKWNLMMEIKEKHKAGISERQLAKDYSISRETIRKYIRAKKPVYWPSGYKRGSKLDPYKELIVELLDNGNTHEEILNILIQQGYDGSRSLISTYINKNGLKKGIYDDKKGISYDENKSEGRKKSISIHTVTKIICKNDSNLTKDELNILESLKESYHKLVELKELIDNFKGMFLDNKLPLEKWMTKAREFNIPELNSFVNGIKRDIDSVKNSFTSSYTNGLLEGIINKIKEIKRMSYGRCKFDLLRIKVFNHQEIFG